MCVQTDADQGVKAPYRSLHPNRKVSDVSEEERCSFIRIAEKRIQNKKTILHGKRQDRQELINGVRTRDRHHHLLGRKREMEQVVGKNPHKRKGATSSTFSGHPLLSEEEGVIAKRKLASPSEKGKRQRGSYPGKVRYS